MRYWTSHRFAPEVFAAVDRILDQFKTTHHTTQFSLWGYSGGAYIAMRLAAARADVTDVTTIAGLLDPPAWTQFHDISPLVGVASALTINPKVTYRHFCGTQDDIVPCTLIQDFIDRHQGEQSLTVINTASHSTIIGHAETFITR